MTVGPATMRGFSLLEMLVVLVLMGLAAALVAPSLSRTADRVREAGPNCARIDAQMPVRTSPDPPVASAGDPARTLHA